MANLLQASKNDTDFGGQIFSTALFQPSGTTLPEVSLSGITGFKSIWGRPIDVLSFHG
jgi:hypothetical protein